MSSQTTTNKTRPNLLYLAHRFPYPPNKGDRIRTFHILKYLAAQCDVSLATLADESVAPNDIDALASYCKQLEVVEFRAFTRLLSGLKSAALGCTISEGVFASNRLHAVIDRWCRDTRFDAVLLSASSMAGYLRQPALNGIRTVVDLVDIDSEKWREYAANSRWPKRSVYNLEARRMRRLEIDLLRRADAVTLVSEAEAELLREISSENNLTETMTGKICAVPNGVDLEYFSPVDSPTELTCVFVGTMDYYPNVEGVVWFCNEVWPSLRKIYTNCEFHIVGRRPVSVVRNLSRLPGVVVTGAVADVRPYLAGASAVVAPLRIARGVQNKVLEAMAMGRPVVASAEALAGIPAQQNRHLLLARSVTEWIDALNALLSDPSCLRELGNAAREYVEEQHNWNNCLAPLCLFPDLPTSSDATRTSHRGPREPRPPSVLDVPRLL